MKRQFVLALLTSAFLGQAAMAENATKPADAPAAGAPKLQVDRVLYDFGKTSSVTKVEGVFVLSNVGGGVLEPKPKPACGCTITALKKPKLGPGEKTEMPFTLNIGTMNRGVMQKNIGIESNDPTTPMTTVSIKVEVVPVYDLNPQTIQVGDLRVGATTNLTVNIKRTDGQPFGIARAEAGVANVTAKIERAEGAPQEGTLQVSIVADGQSRRFNSAISLYAEGGSQPIMILPIGGRIVGDLVLSQESLFWGIADADNWPPATLPQPERATTRRIDVKSNLPEQLTFGNVASTIPELKVSIATGADGKMEIVAVLAKAPKATTTGSITVETNAKSQPVITIPVTVNVIPKRG